MPANCGRDGAEQAGRPGPPYVRHSVPESRRCRSGARYPKFSNLQEFDNVLQAARPHRDEPPPSLARHRRGFRLSPCYPPNILDPRDPGPPGDYATSVRPLGVAADKGPDRAVFKPDARPMRLLGWAVVLVAVFSDVNTAGAQSLPTAGLPQPRPELTAENAAVSSIARRRNWRPFLIPGIGRCCGAQPTKHGDMTGRSPGHRTLQRPQGWHWPERLPGTMD